MLSRTALRATRLRASAIPRQQLRTYAEQHAEPGGRATTKSSPTPIIVTGLGLFALAGYYFLHSDKAPGDGQATIKAARRSSDHDVSQERRDVRDSPVKTLDDKKRKETGEPVIKGR